MSAPDPMGRALELAWSVRAITSPNPWVGAVITTADGEHEAATEPPGGSHAEAKALALAGAAARGSTVHTTLEPCAHHGRTPPCTDALIEAGVARVVIGMQDPDPKVRGRGIARMRAAGIDVEVGVREEEVRQQLAPYVKHRTSGRPWVVVKLAATLDGRTAAPDGSSRWITGPAARADVHRLRSESDAMLVGAGTVKADDPSLTARDANGVALDHQPLRVVLGQAPPGARCQPCREVAGDLGAVLDDLGRRDVMQVLVEGGATVAGAFHRAGLVDRYVLYLAPALLGGDDGRPLFAGAGAATIGDAWRGRVVSLERLGDDLRLEVSG